MNVGILGKLLLITLLTTGVVLSVSFYSQPRKGIPKRMDKVILESEEEVRHIITKCKELMTDLDMERVVVWGYKEGYHTHCHIHKAWYDAFQFLGVTDLHWEHAMEYKKAPSNAKSNVTYDGRTANTLFITEGQVCDHMPWEPDGYYVWHNVDLQRTPIPDTIPPERHLKQQFYTESAVGDSYPVLDHYHRLRLDDNECFMPWATNINPYEFIDPVPPQKGGVVVVGQPGDIYRSKISKFVSGLKDIMPLNHCMNIPHTDAVNMIHDSTLAPSIINQWQKDHGYIPCRIFKNTSYGAFPLTTSLHGHRCLQRTTLYEEDEKTLGKTSHNVLKTYRKYSDLHKLAWHLTKTRHTYLNRIYFILRCFKIKKDKEDKKNNTTNTILHITYSKSVEEHITWMAQQRRVSVEHWNMRTKENMGKNVMISQDTAEQWWHKYNQGLKDKQLIILSGNPLVSRFLWSHMDSFTGKVIVWLHESASMDWDKETQRMWTSWTQTYMDRVKVIHSCKAFRVQNVLNHLMASGIFSDHCLLPLGRNSYDPLHYSSLPNHVVNDQNHYLFSPSNSLNDNGASNQQTISIPENRLQTLGVQWYQGRFNGLNDVKDFAALLWIPHKLSCNLVYESWALDKVWYIPSWDYFKTLRKHVSDDFEVWQESVWYCHEHRHLFVYFDSWEDLQQKWYAKAHHVKEHLIKDYRTMIEKQNMLQWDVLMTQW